MRVSRLRALAAVCLAVCLLVPVLAAGGAGAQPQLPSGPSLADVELRDNLIAQQESLLNAYRCLHQIDVAAVPGGCSGTEPARGPTQPGAFTGTPTQNDIAARDNLIADQETLLNAYRCRFNTDTQLVPQGCNTQPQPTTPTTAPEGTYTAIAAGRWHSCALTTGGAATCWGDNRYGQADAPDGTYTAIAAGDRHSCAITTGGAATCWGYNSEGQADAPDGTYTAIAAGSDHACALTTEGTASCWGRVDHPRAGTYTAITAAGGQSCAITTEGAITCWGSISAPWRALDGTYTAIAAAPAAAQLCAITTEGTITCKGLSDYHQVDAPEGTYTAIAAGGNRYCAITTGGTATCIAAGGTRICATESFCWGAQASLPDSIHSSTFTAIAVGHLHACAITTQRTIACWGWNTIGQAPQRLVPGYTFYGSSPSTYSCTINVQRTSTCRGNIPTGTHTAITVGRLHSCAISTEGAATCWGDNEHGKADAPDGTYTAIAAGNDHSCAITTEGAATCWGDNEHGKADAPDGTYTAIAAGGLHSCAITTEGAATCWGFSGLGETDAPDGTYTAIAAGHQVSCAITTEGTATCWGNGTHVPDGTYTAISLGDIRCGLTTEGTVTCWNDRGRAAVPVGTYTAIAVGPIASDHLCAITTQGNATCWVQEVPGAFDYRQPPVVPPRDGTYTAIAAGMLHACALSADQAIVCWDWTTSLATDLPPGIAWAI